MQRPAKPKTPVQFRLQPPLDIISLVIRLSVINCGSQDDAMTLNDDYPHQSANADIKLANRLVV